jgi:hypothetical protein
MKTGDVISVLIRNRNIELDHVDDNAECRAILAFGPASERGKQTEKNEK